MSLDEALLDAIIAAPDDPAARLVYADHRLATSASDTHAELIVVQERLHALGASGLWRDAYSEEAFRLRARERTLVAKMDDHLDLPRDTVTWRRGFVHRIALGARTPANLAKRIRHPAFSVVHALRVRAPDIDLGPIAEQIAAVDDLSFPAALVRDEVVRYPPPASLEVTEDAEIHDAALAAVIPWLPPVTHLTLVTQGPLPMPCVATIGAWASREYLSSLTVHPSERIATAGLHRETDLLPLPSSDRDAAARGYVFIGDYYGARGRFTDAANHYDDAICLSQGTYPGLDELYKKAAAAAGIEREPHQPDPERDGLTHRVPALMRWGEFQRVLDVAPDHPGALAENGLALRREFELDAAEDAFARVVSTPLARAYTLMLEDPATALEILNGAPPAVEANVLFACIHALQGKPELALGLLRDQPHPFARLALGLCTRHAGSAAAGRAIWLELARTAAREPPRDPALWVAALFAAVLASADPYALRRLFHQWLEGAGPQMPQPALVFDPLIRLANKVMPPVDLMMVQREVERVRGAAG